jgi:hypothetical protein
LRSTEGTSKLVDDITYRQAGDSPVSSNTPASSWGSLPE